MKLATRGRFSSIIYNYAGSGWTTQNHINHGTVSALAAQTPKPIAVFIQMNVNDRLKDSVTVSPAYGGMSWSAYLANTRTIIRELIAANILPILVKEDNSPLPAGAGWKWGEYTAMGGTNTGTNDATHRPFSDYVNAYDTIAADTEWVTDGVGPLTVLDAYKPSLNTGQEPQYRYQYSDSTYDLTSDGLAPADFRHSLMHGWGEVVSVNDVWHQNDTGGAIILGVYQSFFNSPFLSAAR